MPKIEVTEEPRDEKKDRAMSSKGPDTKEPKRRVTIKEEPVPMKKLKTEEEPVSPRRKREKEKYMRLLRGRRRRVRLHRLRSVGDHRHRRRPVRRGNRLSR